jgi:hypothetical protein
MALASSAGFSPVGRVSGMAGSSSPHHGPCCGGAPCPRPEHFSSQVISLGDSENAIKNQAFSSQVISLGDSENAIKNQAFSSQVISLGDSENAIKQKSGRFR